MDIIGHESQRTFLAHVGARGIAHHTFLFAGPAHVGKRTVAEAFAGAWVRAVPPVWTTDHDVNAWRDIIVLAPTIEEKKGVQRVRGIDVAQVRAARRQIALGSDSTRRVLICDALDTASNGAQNALLKTIEEPPHGTIVILVTADPAKILPTIRSRALRVDFGLVDDALLGTYEGARDDIVSLSLGRPGLLHDLVADADLAARAQDALDALTNVRMMPTHERLHLADQLAKDVDYATYTLTLWVWQIRTAALTSGKVHVLTIAARMEETLRALRQTSSNKRLALEHLLLHL